MKKPSLAVAMGALDTRPGTPSVATAMAQPPVPLPGIVVVQPGRVGKKQVLGWFSAECKKQIKLMGADMGMTEQYLLAEALNDLFVKYGKSKLA